MLHRCRQNDTDAPSLPFAPGGYPARTGGPRGEAAIARPARGLLAPPAARYYGEVPQRGAERSGGFRGVVPPG